METPEFKDLQLKLVRVQKEKTKLQYIILSNEADELSAQIEAMKLQTSAVRNKEEKQNIVVSNGKEEILPPQKQQTKQKTFAEIVAKEASFQTHNEDLSSFVPQQQQLTVANEEHAKKHNVFTFPKGSHKGKRDCLNCGAKVHLVKTGEFIRTSGTIDRPEYFFDDNGILHEHQSSWFIRENRCKKCEKIFKQCKILAMTIKGIPKTVFEVIYKKEKDDEFTIIGVLGVCNH